MIDINFAGSVVLFPLGFFLCICMYQPKLCLYQKFSWYLTYQCLEIVWVIKLSDMFEKYFPSAIEQYSFMQLLDAFEIRYINFTFQIMFYESRFVIVFFWETQQTLKRNMHRNFYLHNHIIRQRHAMYWKKHEIIYKF